MDDLQELMTEMKLAENFFLGKDYSNYKDTIENILDKFVYGRQENGYYTGNFNDIIKLCLKLEDVDLAKKALKESQEKMPPQLEGHYHSFDSRCLRGILDAYRELIIYYTKNGNLNKIKETLNQEVNFKKLKIDTIYKEEKEIENTKKRKYVLKDFIFYDAGYDFDTLSYEIRKEQIEQLIISGLNISEGFFQQVIYGGEIIPKDREDLKIYGFIVAGKYSLENKKYSNSRKYLEEATILLKENINKSERILKIDKDYINNFKGKYPNNKTIEDEYFIEYGLNKREDFFDYKKIRETKNMLYGNFIGGYSKIRYILSFFQLLVIFYLKLGEKSKKNDDFIMAYTIYKNTNDRFKFTKKYRHRNYEDFEKIYNYEEFLKEENICDKIIEKLLEINDQGRVKEIQKTKEEKK